MEHEAMDAYSSQFFGEKYHKLHSQIILSSTQTNFSETNLQLQINKVPFTESNRRRSLRLVSHCQTAFSVCVVAETTKTKGLAT